MCRRALVIDDNLGVRIELGRILRQLGYEVFRATNRKEAINAVVVYKPDIVFIDLNLKTSIDGLGVEVIREMATLEEADKRIVILMSLELDCSPEEKERYKREERIHLDGLLSKPFNEEEVRLLLKEVA